MLLLEHPFGGICAWGRPPNRRSELILYERTPLRQAACRATHGRLADLGLSPSPIVSGRIHRSFTVRDPSGQDVEFNSSHVSGRPV